MMNTNFNSIEEYITSFDTQGQEILRKLRAIIQNNIPDEAKEVINYQMPTIKYKGNMIHYALYKKHLGIYPGPDAIVHFSDRLIKYKTSKGAIQIPLDQPLPEKLIKDILLFNIKMMDKRAKTT